MTEPLVWEATTPVYTRWISERRYRNLRPYAQRWYRPICPQCGPALAAGSRRAKTAQPVECEASQSGPKGNAQTQSGHHPKGNN